MREGGNSESREPFELGRDIYPNKEIREVKSSPDKLVRTESLVYDDIDRSIAHYADVKKMFEDMRDNYGVNIPDIEMVVGEKNKGEKRVFMVVDKIDGKNLYNTEKLAENLKDKFENFYVGLLQSSFDSYKNQKPFFNDHHSGQFIYGHKSKDKAAENNFFLVDIGDGFARYKADKPGDYDGDFFKFIVSTAEDIKGYEKKFGKDIVLNSIRSKIKEIYEYCKMNRKEELDKFFDRLSRHRLFERKDFENFFEGVK